MRRLILCSILLLGLTALQQGAAGDNPPKAGRFTTTFTVRSPLSDVEEIKSRLGERMVAQELAARHGDSTVLRQPHRVGSVSEAAYNLADESYSVYVPSTPDASNRYGLLVWVDPQGTGELPGGYASIMDEFQLIWIAPVKSGNNRPLWHRLAPAIDAVYNMRQQYGIDADRVYVGGFVDGARSASFLAVAYPELFRGGFYLHGGYFFKPVPVPNQPGRYYSYFQMPPQAVFEKAKTHNRYAFLAGDHEMYEKSAALAKATYGSYVDIGFKHVTYLEAPGLGRRYPTANWFRKGVAFLEGVALEDAVDEPIVSEVTERRRRTARFKASPQPPADDVHLAPGAEVRLEAKAAQNTFLVYVPLDYTPERPWPIIFCYHGYNGSATTWPFKQVTKGEGFIIVGMNYATKGYHQELAPHKTGPEKAFFDEALRIVSAHLNVDPAFVFMGGYSQGGYSTTALGEQMLDRLAGRLVLGAGRRDVDQDPPPLDKLRGKPVFFGVGELDDPHYLRAKKAAEVYRQWGADVTFEAWPGETHGLSPNWLQKTTLMHEWLIAHGPAKQAAAKLAQARAAEQAGRLGDALALYNQAALILPDSEAADAAQRLFQQADAALADAMNAPYADATQRLNQLAETYAGSVFSDLAKQQLAGLLNTKADELEARARAAEATNDKAKALQLYDLYLSYFAGADRYQTVKAHVESLRKSK